MFLRAGAQSLTARLRAGAATLFADRRGVAAVEFAFIAPLLLAMYFVTMEVSQGIETSKKVSRIGSMVADLVAQQSQSVERDDLDAIMKIAEATLQPYNRSQPKIIVTAIRISTDNTPKVQVAWSRKMVNGVYSVDAAANSTTTVPASLNIKGSFLIRVQSQLDYKPVITWAASAKKTLGLLSAFDNIAMNETYYLRPRMSPEIACPKC